LSNAPYQIRRYKQFDQKLDSLIITEQERILNKIREELCKDPFRKSYPLEGKYKQDGIRSFRVGDYKILCKVEGKTTTIHLFDIGKRSTIYRF